MTFTRILLPALLGALVIVALAYAMRYLPERFQSDGGSPAMDMVYGLFFLFFFVIGLAVTAQLTALGKAQDAASAEANDIGELYWFAHAMPQPEHGQLQVLLRNYATIVAHKEWPLLASGKTSSAASAAVRAIRENILAFTPTTDSEKTLYSNALTDVSSLFNSRRVKNGLSTQGQPAIMLESIFILGALVVVLFPLAGLMKRPRDYSIYGIFAVVCLGSVLFVRALNNPFAGPVAVSPKTFDILFNGVFVNVK